MPRVPSLTWQRSAIVFRGHVNSELDSREKVPGRNEERGTSQVTQGAITAGEGSYAWQPLGAIKGISRSLVSIRRLAHWGEEASTQEEKRALREHLTNRGKEARSQVRRGTKAMSRV